MSPKIFSLLGIIFFFSGQQIYAQQELKICALRVEFQEDDNKLTTGNGLFVLDATGVTDYTVDPPPHNRPYFQDQILAVRNYYRAASKGKLEISGQVFPLAKEAAYQLANTMGHYNPNSTDEENNAMLAQLFIDAVTEADKDPDLDFSDYDVVTIFHAGVGKDVELGFDETPQDLPSLYFTTGFFRKYYDPDFAGIPVDNGTILVDRGLLLPETESQAGFEIGLTGLFAANLGSHLGLYDLFSPSEQLSGIGAFGVMDAGLFNALGLSPALPSAFSRLLLGWEDPVILRTPAQNLPVYRFAAGENQDLNLYKIPINTSEYYLIENRGDHSVILDSLYFELAEGREEPPTYLELFKKYFPDRIEVSDSTGVLLSVENYDWGLPGSGILIWHIDEAIIAEKGPENKLNDDRQNRAVDLEEADGSQDIGYEYSIVEPGFQSELGTWIDFWYAGNPSPLYQNKFSSATAPNTRANRTLANSHIEISDISDNKLPYMTFSFDLDFFEPGFPVQIDQHTTSVRYSDPLVGTVNLETNPVLFVSGSDGNIYSVIENGDGLLAGGGNLVAVFPESEMSFIVLADTSQDQINDLLFATGVSGLISGYGFSDANNDQLLDTMFTVDLGQAITANPVFQYPFLYVGTDLGNVYRMHFSGLIDSVYHYPESIAAITLQASGQVIVTLQETGVPSFPPVLIDIDSDGDYDTITYPGYKRIRFGDIEISLVEKMQAAPAYADMDNDGFYEIILISDATIYVYNYNGAYLSNFPVQPVLQEGETLSGSPLIFDADGDQISDIIVTTSHGQLFAFNQKGQLGSGYPFTAAGMMPNSGAICDIDGDDKIEIFAINEQGMIFGWELPAQWQVDQSWWTQAGFNAQNNHFVAKKLTVNGLPFSDLMPGQRVYVYPNPNKENYTNIRYYLSQPAAVDIKIFDLAGDLVDSFSGPGQGQVDNEIRWNLDDISSGIYLCRIEAVSSGERGSKIIKVMVIK